MLETSFSLVFQVASLQKCDAEIKVPSKYFILCELYWVSISTSAQ